MYHEQAPLDEKQKALQSVIVDCIGENHQIACASAEGGCGCLAGAIATKVQETQQKVTALNFLLERLRDRSSKPIGRLALLNCMKQMAPEFADVPLGKTVVNSLFSSLHTASTDPDSGMCVVSGVGVAVCVPHCRGGEASDHMTSCVPVQR